MKRFGHGRRHARRLTILTLAAAVTAGAGMLALAAPALSAATNPTIVTLTFDDSLANQMPAEQTMTANGLVGTFYTVDGWVGTPGFLTRADLSQIAADGNEIGGHTLTHPDLIDVAPSEAQRQICDNRANLQSWGYKPVDFAYPFSDANPTVEALAKSCGYNTARGLGDIRSPESCKRCPYAEVMPPQDPYYLKAPDEVDSTWTLAQLQAEVTNAVNHRGGWVILTFHNICADIGAADCPADTATTPAIFSAFVTWLASYAKTAANKTTVRTIDQVVRQYLGASYPAYVNATPVGAPPPAPVGTNAVTNPSLETNNAATGFPTCFQAGGWGSNTVSWARTTDAHAGTAAEQLTVTNYTSGDAKLLPTLDLGTCSPTVVAGTSYNLGVWYHSTAITQFALYYRNAAGAWFYWTSSPWFAPSSTWTQATYTTPPAPADAVGMSFGLALIANGTLVTDDYSMVNPGTTQATTQAAATNAVLLAARPASSVAGRSVAAKPFVTKYRTHVRPLVPGGRNAHQGQQIAVPEIGPEIGNG